MAHNLSGTEGHDPYMFVSGNDTRTTQNTSVPTGVHNASHVDGCLTVVFSEMEFLPWDNPDNVISEEVEELSSRVMDAVLAILFPIGGPGNVINMAVFYKQGLKDRVNLCLFALALADFLYLTTAMCHRTEETYLQFTSNEKYGPVFTFLSNNFLPGFYGFLYVSPVLTAILASERCYCVLKPLKYQTLMRTRTMAAIIIVVYIVVVGLYFIVAFRFYIGCVYDPVTGIVMKTASTRELYLKHKDMVDNIDSIVFGIGLPGIVMIVVMSATITTIVKLRQIATWRSEASSSLSSSEVALTKMLVGTSVLFIICIFPFAVTRISWQFFPEVNAGGRHHNLFLTGIWINEVLTYINSSLNIFVYYAMGSRYRESVKSLFCKNRHSHRERKNTSRASDTKTTF